MDALKNIIGWGLNAVQSPRYSRYAAIALLCFDGVLSYVILRKIPYTEIDWEAYMEQVAQYRAGERDYRNIKGGTGPLVYPAGHVYIYNWLYSLTDGGAQREITQAVFWVTYLATLWIAMACYRAAKAPPWIMVLLVLSKRLHSIYLLRFFNDCFSTLLIFGAMYMLQKWQYTLSAVLCSLSIGVKMSSLLYLPAFGLIYVLCTDTAKALRMAMLMVQIQVVLAIPFVVGEGGSLIGYVSRAFELSRAFLWQWTVNWRFVGEEVFSSAAFKYALLAAHAALLLFFLATRWIRPAQRNLIEFIQSPLLRPVDSLEGMRIARRADGAYMLTTLFTCNLIGVLCARSLHYQFYSWIAWTTPFVLWRSGWGPLFVVPVWAAQEYAWNVYPSTKASSAIAVGCMAVQLVGVWFGTGTSTSPKEDQRKEQ
ncbi:dolichyl-P-Man:Man(5)GlcNAc(2)-PP-dolichol alpha-1,3-mannosyltransferase [Orbilia brochopaga]|uniref:Dol-P-Man:Man(5)GlcNAc(2)-PP-Dol alpha-1,3-mannosyltransferase n=1 Tax=Orbilia brochopaga TaxID=3140254 RepID=A0AAV9U489_9PEZI